MEGFLTFLWVLGTGVLFTTADILARQWGLERGSVTWFVLMAIAGTAGYASFGLLAVAKGDFTKAVVWVSLSLTTLSAIYGTLWLKEPLTKERVVALVLALCACYLMNSTAAQPD